MVLITENYFPVCFKVLSIFFITGIGKWYRWFPRHGTCFHISFTWRSARTICSSTAPARSAREDRCFPRVRTVIQNRFFLK